MRWHDRASPLRRRIFAPPKTRHSLLLCIELQALLAVESIGATSGDALLVTREAEHRQGNGDRDVDANLAGLDVFLEAGCGAAGTGENGGAVAVLVGVDKIDGFVNGLDIEADEDWTEDFLGIAFHMRLNIGDEGWADLEFIRHERKSH